MKPSPLHALPTTPEATRVCEIRFTRHDEHESRCLLAWKRREHPGWSQHCVSFRVSGPKIRRIK